MCYGAVTMSRRGRLLTMFFVVAGFAPGLVGVGCDGETPRDIRYGTDAEANFEAPVEEVKPRTDASDAGGAGGAAGGAAGAAGASAGAAGGAAGAAGSDAAVSDAAAD
jgi:hypothetical protein